MRRLVRAVFIMALAGLCEQRVQAKAVNFQEPNDWSVGDPDSTFQEWAADPVDFIGDPNVFLFSMSGTTPSSETINPSISLSSTMGVKSPGFVSSSGGYYSYTGNYSLYADIRNHGGSAGSGGPYTAKHGTRVIVQTAANVNDDPNVGGPASVFSESLELVDPNGNALMGGDNSDALGILEVSDPNVLVDGPFGPSQQQELIYEFWLPGYTGDFRIQTDLIVHSSFQHLRVDTIIEEFSPDFNGNGFVDGPDLLVWQRSPKPNGSSAGLATWQSEYGNPSFSPTVSAVPEPSTTCLLLAGVIGVGTFAASKRRY